jgi:hypothetical protein
LTGQYELLHSFFLRGILGHALISSQSLSTNGSTSFSSSSYGQNLIGVGGFLDITPQKLGASLTYVKALNTSPAGSISTTADAATLSTSTFSASLVAEF